MRMGEVVVIDDEEETEVEMEVEEDEEDLTTTPEEVVRWERFLPKMVLRVLLVEADDSTRQIIAALLRKCNYRVVAVPNGLKAWEKLKGSSHDIDLVLTEVELPSISGFTLLTLVMEHDVCKNIPVIMMSSCDSISMVLKCMFKGAADFLIKPVRKNELRNLWQHVWRRQTLTGGHVRQNLTVSQKTAEATSENNAASNDSSDCVASSQKNIECSGKGSDAQGLSQMKRRSASNLSNTNTEKHGGCAKLDKQSILPESEIGEKSNRLGSEVAFSSEACNSTALRLKEDHSCAKTMTQSEGVGSESNRGNVDITSEIRGSNDELVEPSRGAIDLIGTFDNHPTCNYENSSYTDGATNKFEFAPQLELSLRRTCPSSSNDQGTDERHMLNRSKASAFSWYNNCSKTLQPLLPTLSSNCTKSKEGVSKAHDLSSNQFSGSTNGTSLQHGATLSSSQENITTLDIGQSRQAEEQFPSHQFGAIHVPGVRWDDIRAGYGHVFPSLFYTQSGLPPAWSPKPACQREQSPLPTSTSIQSNQDIHNSDQGYHQSDETTNNAIDQAVHEENDLEPVEELRHGSASGQTTTTASTSSLCNGGVNHINSSAYGNICDKRDGSATSAPESLNGSNPFIHDGSRGVDSHLSSQREAALTKFRLKRKERCFEKKVRYQSRKRLAEQRPRVKGQFVRQPGA